MPPIIHLISGLDRPCRDLSFLNLAWTPLFFGAHLLGVALVAIVALWIMILLTILKFRPLDRLASRLLIPYLIWVSYAAYLNAGIFILNRAG